MTIPTLFDYTNQAWVVDSRYVKCGHLIEGIDQLTQPGDQFTDCSCYGRKHEGEAVILHLKGDCVDQTINGHPVGPHVEVDCPAEEERASLAIFGDPQTSP